MSKNILIVESQNDQYFIQALLEHLQLENIEVGSPICNIDDFECMEGGLSKLGNSLVELKGRIEKDNIEMVGILLDADSDGILGKIEKINEKMRMICSDVVFGNINQSKVSKELQTTFVCCVTHVEGSGELETLLRAIKTEESAYADCLNKWKECLMAQGKVISEKEFDKFWVNIYQRYDTCSNEEKKQAGRKCNFEAAMKKRIWDFKHDKLNDIRTFLQTFKEK